MTSPTVRLQRVGHQYGPGAWALRDVTLEIGAGGITALIGANGSGKSTLLRILAGELRSSEGEVELFGRPAGAFRTQDLRHKVGLVPQDAALDPDMTAKETLEFFAALYGVPAADARRRITTLLAAFELEPLRDQLLARVSGGQRQRVHLALGFLQSPPLVLFDEPANGLDPVLRAAFWAMLKTYCAAPPAEGSPKNTAVVVTHDLADVAEHAETVVVLSRGALIAAGRPAEILAQTGGATLAEAYAALTGESIGPRREGRMRGQGKGRRQ
jgi:ABC-type multidrug transport system ATPase subunit